VTDFDRADDDSFVLEEQAQTAIYHNEAGQVIIRQRGWPDDDAFVVIDRAHLQTVIDKLEGMRS
jgi:hypothetical protein